MTTRSTYSACTASAVSPAHCSPACSRSARCQPRADAPGASGLLEGNPGQSLIQAYGVVVTIVWSGVMTWSLLKVIDLFLPLRVTQQKEIEGLDITPARRSVAIIPRFHRKFPTRPARKAGRRFAQGICSR